MDNYIFDECRKINEYLLQGSKGELNARDHLIQLLDYLQKKKIARPSIVNHLIRQTGLYPYLNIDSTNQSLIESIHWQDRFAYEAFKVDIGGKYATLHREQSRVLKRLIEGDNLAVSAPTSFGKSFIIDAFITLKKPNNIVIIVPTIALMDETRRRLHKKFSKKYKIITTSDATLADRNILIFPQERAVHYANVLDKIDMLVVDEFYKASSLFDKERSPALINAVMKLGEKARQKYFSAPNISKIAEGFLTSDLTPIILNFNTVYLEVVELFKKIEADNLDKNSEMIDLLKKSDGKTIVYAGTYSGIRDVCRVISEQINVQKKEVIQDFQKWLMENYSQDWDLVNVLDKNTGIHNGQLHRPLSQIQMKLFEEIEGLTTLVTTSSVIEGVNTSAENVIIWSNKNGNPRLNYFSYKNLQGRAGRMFKHFIGKIYVLEPPPVDEDIQLTIEFPDQLVGAIDLDELDDDHQFTKEQIASVIKYKNEMKELLGNIGYEELEKEGLLKIGDSKIIYNIAKEVSDNPEKWKNLIFLNSDKPEDWEFYLYEILKLGLGWGTRYSNFVNFIMIISNNWKCSIPELLAEFRCDEVNIGTFFKLERNVTFKLASLLNDVNVLQKIILKNSTDISPFITKISNAFLPPLVYQLEEYGLPRMVSKKIHKTGVIDLEKTDVEISSILDMFTAFSISQRNMVYEELKDFDIYLYEHFLDGITAN